MALALQIKMALTLSLAMEGNRMKMKENELLVQTPEIFWTELTADGLCGVEQNSTKNSIRIWIMWGPRWDVINFSSWLLHGKLELSIRVGFGCVLVTSTKMRLGCSRKTAIDAQNLQGSCSRVWHHFGVIVYLITEYVDYLVISGAPNENIVQNHLNIALLNVF